MGRPADDPLRHQSRVHEDRRRSRPLHGRRPLGPAARRSRGSRPQWTRRRRRRGRPVELFDGLSESEALALAREAIDHGDGEAARALLDRFDDARTRERDPAPGSNGRTNTLGRFEGLRDLATAAADREDDEIGGYVYDLYAVGAALRSRARRVVLVFTAVLATVFALLYEGGFGLLSAHFLSRAPAAARLESGLVALHPVEVLLFQMEISTIVAVVVVAPLCAYYAWPALIDRGLVRGRRRTVLVWTGGLVATFLVATIAGYLYVAPAMLSYLISDALRAGLVVSYRIDRVAWLVVYTTVGVGVLACIPVAMWLLHRAGSVSYRGCRERWRGVVILVLVLASLLSPGVLSMLLAAASTMIAYGVGLLGLWCLTLGGRRDASNARGP